MIPFSSTPRRKPVPWDRIPTFALAGCTLAGGANASPSKNLPAFPTISGPDYRMTAPWLSTGHGSRDLSPPKQFLFQHDHILGTSLDLTVWATDTEEATLVESVILAEIDRLTFILNRHDPQSEVSRINDGISLSGASPDLIAILQAYESWGTRTKGVLSGQLGSLIRLWKMAETIQSVPTAMDLATCLSTLQTPGWTIDLSNRQVRYHGLHSLNIDGLGKGYILQRAVEVTRALFPGIWGIMLNIGGDVSVWGNGSAQAGTPWQIFCANPFQYYDNARPLTSVRISCGAVATSAAYQRGFTIAGQRYSHILDPRTGWPARGVASATAIARDNMTANALATTLCILTPREGLELLRTIEDVEGLIITTDGTLFRSSGFAALELPIAQISPAPSAIAPSTTASEGIPSSNGTPSLTPGQRVNIVTDASIHFVKGTASMQRPVQSDEEFRVTVVNGEDVTVADKFGFEAILNCSLIKPLEPPATTILTPSPATSGLPLSPATNTTPVIAQPPATVGQIANILKGDQVSFSKGTASMKRPVQSDEQFQVTGVNGDQITLTDRFGFVTTLNRGELKITDAPSPPKPIAIAPPSTNAVPAAPANTSASSSWPAGYQVTLALEIPPPPAGTTRVRRPYVAIWVEDASGKEIRTVTVWGNSAKWLPDLSNWWKFAKGQNNLVSSTTRATRDAGKYQVFWDGLDDGGKPVGQGTYTLVLEVNRQHGAHETHRTTIDCNGSPSQATIPGATEFLDCPLTYGPS